jgi:GNAT superfamily N-acetyltransferase
MPIRVRRAVLADVQVIAEFNWLLAKESEGVLLDRAVLDPGVCAVLEDPAKGLYYLADDGGRILGQIGLTFEYSDWRRGWFWWIQSVYVRPESRRQGVFRSLFDHVHQLAVADPEVIGLRLYVEEENAGALATYERLGLIKTGYLVRELFPLR